MKKVIGIMMLVLLCGCSMAGDHLTSEQYDEVTLARYEESASLTLYEGENFEAKLVLFDRYVNENNELYYECRILIKPLMEMNGKDLQVQLKPNEAQERYYSADQSQRMFQTMHYPIKKTADQYDCIEFMYRLGSHGFLEMWSTVAPTYPVQNFESVSTFRSSDDSDNLGYLLLYRYPQ